MTVPIVTFLIVVVIGATVSAVPCDPKVTEGTGVIFRNHCPIFKKLLAESEAICQAYLVCLTSNNYKVYDAIKTCTGVDRPPIADIVKAVCSTDTPAVAKASENMMCCIITNEVIPIGKTGSDKVDISRQCIDKVTKVCP